MNDTYGHQQGDQVLARWRRVLRDLSRDIDEPARYGGEEMAVILPQTDAAGAGQLAERMREAIEALQVPRAGRRRGAARHGQLRRGGRCRTSALGRRRR